ncbi:uncharacterized protein Fot_38150 [Forsythia ovata]|uniref:Uncharacterized protein n=1 Tax=Forsythia ovata TaxID=205694 RepID=A0ABD1S3B3_9LAMI
MRSKQNDKKEKDGADGSSSRDKSSSSNHVNGSDDKPPNGNESFDWPDAVLAITALEKAVHDALSSDFQKENVTTYLAWHGMAYKPEPTRRFIINMPCSCALNTEPSTDTGSQGGHRMRSDAQIRVHIRGHVDTPNLLGKDLNGGDGLQPPTKSLRQAMPNFFTFILKFKCIQKEVLACLEARENKAFFSQGDPLAPFQSSTVHSGDVIFCIQKLLNEVSPIFERQKKESSRQKKGKGVARPSKVMNPGEGGRINPRTHKMNLGLAPEKMDRVEEWVEYIRELSGGHEDQKSDPSY